MSKLHAFTMPKWGIEMTEGVIVEWLVEENDAFARGQVLASVETEKIVNEIEAEFDAVCLRRIAQQDETLAVGELLAVFGEAGASRDDIDAFIAGFTPADTALAGEDDPADETSAESAAIAPEAAPTAVIPAGVRASPLAAQAATQLGVDLLRVTGTGRNARVQRQDVQRAATPQQVEAKPAVSNSVDLGGFDNLHATDVAKRVAAVARVDLRTLTGSGKNGRIRVRDLSGDAELEATRIPFSNMRAQIARRLTASYQEIPHYYLETRARVDDLLTLRAQYNKDRGQSASLNDFVVRAVARALVEHPHINAHVGDNELLVFPRVNVAIAVAIDGGLITPVVRDVDSQPFDALCAQSRELVNKARAGGLNMDDLAGATFTVSNLGMFGVTRFTALINPPQAAILAIGAAERVALEDPAGVSFGTLMNLTLGCDHRAIDGAMGGRFLATLKGLIEDPRALVDG